MDNVNRDMETPIKDSKGNAEVSKSLVWHHQDGDISCYWLCSPSPEQQLTTIHGQDNTERILELRSEAEAPPAPQRPRWTTLKGKRKSYMPTTMPLPQAGTAPCWEALPEPMFPPIFTKWEERAQGWHPGPQPSGSLCGSPYYGFTPCVLQRNLQGSITGSLIEMEKEGRASNNQHLDLCGLNSHLWSLSSSPNQWLCLSANEVNGTVWPRNLARCRSF